MSSSLPLPLNPPISSLPRKFLFPSTVSPFSISKSYLPFILTASPLHASNPHSTPSAPDPEERRWLREEQRWLREETRWLREQQRWRSERERLLREISELKLQIGATEQHYSVRGDSGTETLAEVAEVLQEGVNLIAEKGFSSKPMALEGTKSADVTFEQVVRVSEGEGEGEAKAGEKTKKAALRTGSEGESVRAMQVFTSRFSSPNFGWKTSFNNILVSHLCCYTCR